MCGLKQYIKFSDLQFNKLQRTTNRHTDFQRLITVNIWKVNDIYR